MITKRILIQERSIRTNGCLDEGCVEIHDVPKLILRKSVSDRPVNMEIFEQPDGVGRQRINSISSWDKLKVPRPRVQTTAAEDFAIDTHGQVRRAATNVQIEKMRFRFGPAQREAASHEGEPGLQAGIFRDREQRVADPLLHKGLDGRDIGLLSS